MKAVTKSTFLTILIPILLFACGGGGSSSPPPVPKIVVDDKPVVVDNKPVVDDKPVVIVTDPPILNVLNPATVSFEIDPSVTMQEGESANDTFNRYIDALYINALERFLDESILIDDYLEKTGNLYDSSHSQLYLELSQKMVEAAVIAIKQTLTDSTLTSSIYQEPALATLVLMRNGFIEFMVTDASKHLTPFGQNTEQVVNRIETNINYLYKLLYDDLVLIGIIL